MEEAADGLAPARSDAEAWRLTLENEGLVFQVIIDLFGKGARGARIQRLGSEDDAAQIGRLWLFRACKRWNPEQAELSTYAYRYIRGGLLNELSKGGLIRVPEGGGRKRKDRYAIERERARGCQRMPVNVENHAASLADRTDPGERVDVLDECAWAVACLKRMPQRQREAALEVLTGRQKLREVAAVHGVSHQAVQLWVVRARELLARQHRLRGIAA